MGNQSSPAETGGTPGEQEAAAIKATTEVKPAGVMPGASEQGIIDLIDQGRSPDKAMQDIAAVVPGAAAVTSIDAQNRQENQRGIQADAVTEKGERLENQEKPWPGQEMIKEGKSLPYHQITTPRNWRGEVEDHAGTSFLFLMNQQGEVVAYTEDLFLIPDEIPDGIGPDFTPRIHVRDKIIRDIQAQLAHRGLSPAYRVVVDDLSEEDRKNIDELGSVAVDLKDLTGGRGIDDPSYISTDGLDLGSSYVMDQDERLKQPHNQREEGIVELTNLLADEAFQERFTRVQTAAERAQISTIISEATKAVELRLKPYIEAAAVEKLGVVGIEEGRRLGKTWGEALRAVTQIRTETGAVIPIEDVPAEAGREAQRGARSLIKDQLRPEFEARMAQAQQALRAAEAKQRQALTQMQQELETRQSDPALLDAMEVWGRSPDARGNRSADGQGLHAGVIHYFEYRGNQEKSGRYKESDPVPTIDGFIRYSTQLRELLATPNPASNPAVQTARVIEDEQGRRRMYILTKDGTKLVGFMRTGEPIRVITVIPGANEKAIQKDVDSELNTDPSDPKEQARLNHLGDGRKEVSLETNKT